MTSQHEKKAMNRMKKAALGRGRNRYILRLFVAGMGPRSTVAIRTITDVCEERLKDKYDLEIIDIHRQPSFSKEEQIIAVPTLIKKLPLPMKRLIGDMSNIDRLLAGLELGNS